MSSSRGVGVSRVVGQVTGGAALMVFFGLTGTEAAQAGPPCVVQGDGCAPGSRGHDQDKGTGKAAHQFKSSAKGKVTAKVEAKPGKKKAEPSAKKKTTRVKKEDGGGSSKKPADDHDEDEKKGGKDDEKDRDERGRKDDDGEHRDRGDDDKDSDDDQKPDRKRDESDEDDGHDRPRKSKDHDDKPDDDERSSTSHTRNESSRGADRSRTVQTIPALSYPRSIASRPEPAALTAKTVPVGSPHDEGGVDERLANAAASLANSVANNPEAMAAIGLGGALMSTGGAAVAAGGGISLTGPGVVVGAPLALGGAAVAAGGGLLTVIGGLQILIDAAGQYYVTAAPSDPPAPVAPFVPAAPVPPTVVAPSLPTEAPTLPPPTAGLPEPQGPGRPIPPLLPGLPDTTADTPEQQSAPAERTSPESGESTTTPTQEDENDQGDAGRRNPEGDSTGPVLDRGLPEGGGVPTVAGPEPVLPGGSSSIPWRRPPDRKQAPPLAPLNFSLNNACATGRHWTSVDGMEHYQTGQVLECGPESDRFHAGITRDEFATDRLAPEPVWRSTAEPLYRLENREPAEVFESGFSPWDTEGGQYDIPSYVAVNQPSPFVSTTYREDMYQEWNKRWQYVIDAPWGIDVNASIGNTHDYAGQEEVVFPGGVAPEFIQGVREIISGDDGKTLGPLIPNPNFRPWRSSDEQ
ncbi:hypothetical protein ACFQ68_08485 [Amycolatopsis japonica]|uniref:scabin-related ADP-ribosyltransferase n=1 Tax=Amycolatopsis japonica TaxID=208439 RepID=UPI00366ADE90